MQLTKTWQDLFIITGTTLLLTFLIWLPFWLKIPNFWGLNFSNGIASIYRNYDGLEYVVIAKSFYNPQIISSLPYSLSANYYAAHFPGFSLLILIFAPLMGFLKSMVFVSLVSTILAAISFYFLLKDFKLTQNPLLLSLIFLILPARWLIVHSVGSAEPTFILFTILAIYFFMKFEETKKWSSIWFCAIFGLAALLTRPPGILLFLALIVYIKYKLLFVEKNSVTLFLKKLVNYSPLLIIPLGLLGIFWVYEIQYGDFFAYFHSGDNIHLMLPPFSVFNKHQFWVGDIWLEDIVYIFILGFLGGMYLLKEKLLPMAFFVFTYLTATVLVAHRDISRYALPIFPFVLISFQKVLISKEFRIVLIITALAFYLYAQNFLIENTAPIPNLEVFN